ncbi:MAG: hypothetical protein ACRDRU_29050 [Pseudonocardiaceae bacterium]
MSMVIVLEIIVAIVVLAVAVRFAVRDTRQRRDANPQPLFDSEDTGEAQPRGSKHEAQQPPSQPADQHQVAALSTPSSAPEPPTNS